jgi:hypothetical protein
MAEADESGYRTVAALPDAFTDTQTFLDEIGDEQLNMMVSFVCVERMLDKLPHDPSVHAAAAAVRARLGDIAAVQDALEDVYAASSNPMFATVFAADGHLADFMRGAYVWTGVVLRALERLSVELRDLQPDWARLREKIDEGAFFYFNELVCLIRAEVETLQLTSPASDVVEIEALDERIEEMFFATAMLRAKLDERFG